MRSDLKKLESFTLETSKNHLIRNFLRKGRVRVKPEIKENETFLLQNKWNKAKLDFQFMNLQFYGYP